MALEPQTVNTGLIIPNTGDLVGTWGSAALNPDFVTIDGYVGGVQAVSLSNAPVTLTSPAGFTPTPSAGPTQSQNAVLRFTGTLTANVVVTLPLPGSWIIENLTTGNFVVTFRAISVGEIVSIDQGESLRIYNDGTNVRFDNLGRVGEINVWAGLNSMPAWVGACTKPPYLLCDGSVYTFATYPYLGRRLGGAFGGNGITTFGVPDLRGRIPLIYDGTGTRITTGGSGLNGQTLGASLDKQNNTIITANLPPYTPSGSVTLTALVQNTRAFTSGSAGNDINTLSQGSITGTLLPNGIPFVSGTGTLNGVAQGGTSTPVNNVQPSQVTGIAVIRAA